MDRLLRLIAGLLARLLTRKPPPPGPAGPTAPTGPMGPTGVTAVTGPTGSTGVTPGRMPSGPIRARDPQGRPFAVTWAAIAAWWPEITAAAAEFGAPTARIAAHMLIESQGNRDAIQRNDENGWSWGLMQVVPRWHKALIERLAGRSFRGESDAGQAMIDDPALAIRAGAAILRSNFDRHGSWDRASSAYFTGNPDWRGADTVNGNTGGQYRASLNAILSELWAMLGNDAPGPSPTGPTGPSGDLVFGRVPPPTGMQLRVIWDNTAWDDLGSRQPRGITIHRMLGTLAGTDSYFRGEAAGRALTDFGVGGGGRVYQWNLLDGRRAPWASGPADGVKEDGVAFVSRYGMNAINRDTASVEIEGFQNDPISAADWQALVDLIAWLADSWLKVDYQRWPKNQDGLAALYWHREWTRQKECPFAWMIQNTPRLIEDVRIRLGGYQVDS